MYINIWNKHIIYMDMSVIAVNMDVVKVFFILGYHASPLYSAACRGKCS
jgi:cytochrome c oxidase assembly protein Cox11